MIPDAKIGIYICAPNNPPIFFACGAIFLLLHTEHTSGACVKAGGARRLPYPFRPLS